MLARAANSSCCHKPVQLHLHADGGAQIGLHVAQQLPAFAGVAARSGVRAHAGKAAKADKVQNTYVAEPVEQTSLVTKAANPVFWGGFASAVVVVLAIQKLFPRQLYRGSAIPPVYVDTVTARMWSDTEDAPAFSLDGLYTKGKVVKVWNGNTVTMILPYKGELMKFSCRLKGITVADAKNVSKSMDEADRELEMSQALASKATLEEMVLGRVVVVRCHVSELAGRQMVELWADDGEGPHDEAHSINTEMVRRGMARPFMAKYGTKANKSLSRVKETTKATASMDLPL